MPIYSLVTFGRNDDYNPDFLYRLQTMLNFNARALKKTGLLSAVEFVVVDWGSEVPLREALVLDESVALSTTFLELSPEAAVRASGDSSDMHASKAANVGIRRARGKFIGIQGADLLTTSTSWHSLIMALENHSLNLFDLSKSCLLVPRRQVPWSFVARQPSLNKWEWKLLTCEKTTSMFEGSSPSTGGSMGVVILHRDVWHEVRGLEESFGGYGYYDIDLGFRVGTQYPWVDAASYGVVCYKMQHAPEGRRGRLLNGGQIHMNAPWITTSIHARQSDWGLPHLLIELKKAKPKTGQNSCSPSAMRWPGSCSEPFPEDPALCGKPHIQKHASAALDRSQDFDEKDWELLTVLSWFSLNRFPTNYLEVGMIREWFVRAVVTACPSVDIYAIESAQQNQDNSYPLSLNVAGNLIWKWSHKGYFRPIVGNPLIALERLTSSFIGPFELELALVHLQSEDELQLLPRVLTAMVPGGLLVVRANQAEVLSEAIKLVVTLTVMSTQVYKGESGCTGFIFFSANNGRTTELVVCGGKAKTLSLSGLTVVAVRATILVRQISWLVSRSCRVARWPLYFRLIIAKVFSSS
jgi:hypothetical protein